MLLFGWQYICYVLWACFSTDNQHSYVPTVLPVSPTCSYDIYFLHELLKNNGKKLTQSFNFTFHHLDHLLSLNNCKFGNFIDRIYPIELTIMDITDTITSTSYIDLHFEIDNEGQLRTKLYDKRDDFNFPIANSPFICCNIPTASAYGVCFSDIPELMVISWLPW